MSASDVDRVHPTAGFTRHFVHPGRPLRAVDRLLTGFHDPLASHLAMLYAVAGPETVHEAYREALREGYLWHEFGDSHLIVPQLARRHATAGAKIISKTRATSLAIVSLTAIHDRSGVDLPASRSQARPGRSQANDQEAAPGSGSVPMFTSSISIDRSCDEEGGAELVVGVVGTGSTVRFVAAARSPAALYERLARYVAAAADTQLYAEQADRVRALLAADAVAGAVDAYFTAVGERWDDEWMAVRTVRLEDAQRVPWPDAPDRPAARRCGA